MSSAATGSARERSVLKTIGKLGFYCMRSPASKGVDVYCVNLAGHPPHVAVEAGGSSKRVGNAFKALQNHELPAGTILLLVRWVHKRAIWYSAPDIMTRHTSAEAAIEAAKKALE